ncbi:hypothetical protein LWI28_014370 [Acer negundo]|uniref:Pentatricopeptide repeat-containing protein n=1 Tax=Acer negundo TaxID=4023 RepID=A0AAD5NJP5_ACENE|nr:hypothetical protein LWI28_014370 [Acer negundo]
MIELAEGGEVPATHEVLGIREVQDEVITMATNASLSIMYPAIILPAAPLVSSSSSSVSPTANVGISLGFSRHIDTPHLTLAKSQTSLPTKLSTLPKASSPLSEMATRASRVRSISRQIQRQAPAISSRKPIDHSPVSPPPPPPSIVPYSSQLRVDRGKETISKHGDLGYALKAFDKIPHSYSFIHNAVMRGYLQGGQKVDLVAICREVRRREPTFLLVLTRHYQGCDQIH